MSCSRNRHNRRGRSPKAALPFVVIWSVFPWGDSERSPLGSLFLLLWQSAGRGEHPFPGYFLGVSPMALDPAGATQAPCQDVFCCGLHHLKTSTSHTPPLTLAGLPSNRPDPPPTPKQVSGMGITGPPSSKSAPQILSKTKQNKEVPFLLQSEPGLWSPLTRGPGIFPRLPAVGWGVGGGGGGRSRDH